QLVAFVVPDCCSVVFSTSYVVLNPSGTALRFITSGAMPSSGSGLIQSTCIGGAPITTDGWTGLLTVIFVGWPSRSERPWVSLCVMVSETRLLKAEGRFV